MVPVTVSRRRVGALLALPLVALQAGCVSITVTTDVGADGSIRRSVTLAGGPYREALAHFESRFPAPWTIARDEAHGTLTANLALAAGAPLAPNESAMKLAWRNRIFWTDYRFEEDWLHLRIGHSPPAIAPIPPSFAAIAPILAHEKNLAVIERRTRESIKVALTVTMPGHVRAGNFQKRDGRTLSWDFNFRMPAMPKAESRVYHPLPIAAALAGALALAVFAIWAPRRFAIDSRRRNPATSATSVRPK